MATLTKQDILNSQDFELIELEIPEWGGKVYLRPFSLEQRERLEVAQKNPDATVHSLMGLTVAMSICDEDGNLLFTPDDVDTLKQKSSKAIQDIFSSVTELNGFSDKNADEGNA